MTIPRNTPVELRGFRIRTFEMRANKNRFSFADDWFKQESLANVKVSARQQCVYEGP